MNWLAGELGLGRDHSMAIWAVFEDKRWVEAPRAKQRQVASDG